MATRAFDLRSTRKVFCFFAPRVRPPASASDVRSLISFLGSLLRAKYLTFFGLSAPESDENVKMEPILEFSDLILPFFTEKSNILMLQPDHTWRYWLDKPENIEQRAVDLPDPERTGNSH